jgi:hypothetical protein
MKRPILLALAVGVAAVALWPRRASASVSAPSSVPVDALARLGADARARRVASIAWDTWAAEGIPPIARVGLLAIGWHETRLNPSLRSAAGLRDDALGGSWGAWQVAARTAAALGRPSGAATLGDSDEAIRDPEIRSLIDRIAIEHGGRAYDEQYPDGIPTSVDIEHAAAGTLASGIVRSSVHSI